MDAFLALPDARRRALCEEAGQRLGLDALGVEKDFWVCWTLRELFALPEFGPHLTFKGGTSLSKGWKLIERFSEDIDVVIDRAFLGFYGDRSPESARSNKQRDRQLEHLRAACQRAIREALAPALSQRIRAKVTAGDWRLDSDPDDPDGQTLLFSYPAVIRAGAYVSPVVKIELGARSDTDPSKTPEIQPYLAEAFPEQLGGSSFTVRTLAAERTFWEKVALLHEEGYRTAGAGPAPRLARHYYDVWCLIQRGVAERALADADLFERVVAHRRVFFRKSRESQESLRRGSLRLAPSHERRPAWKQDYNAMREAMLFGEAPDFDDILHEVEVFGQRFNAGVAGI